LGDAHRGIDEGKDRAAVDEAAPVAEVFAVAEAAPAASGLGFEDFDAEVAGVGASDLEIGFSHGWTRMNADE
jgi:hypothetical protein